MEQWESKREHRTLERGGARLESTLYLRVGYPWVDVRVGSLRWVRDECQGEVTCSRRSVTIPYFIVLSSVVDEINDS